MRSNIIDGDEIMNISESNKNYLSIMKDIYEISDELSLRTYIWGGFTTDIFEGKFLREHGDLDGFVINMMPNLNKIINKYEKRGYHTEFRSDINMLEISKGSQHASFNALEVDGCVAMWKHIGNQGTVYFPISWLDATPYDFFNVKVYTSGLCFEYALREIMKYLNPEWNERDKDKIAKKYLKTRILGENLDSQAILKCIWSYNPFWIKKGYNPFERPVLVCPPYTY